MSKNLFKLNLIFVFIFLNIWDFAVNRDFFNGMILGIMMFSPAIFLWFIGTVRAAALTTLISSLEFLVLAVFWSQLPPQTPLFFSKPKGEAQLTPTIFLAAPVVISLILLFINSLFAQTISQYPLLKRMLALSGTIVCILAAITVIRIVFLVL